MLKDLKAQNLSAKPLPPHLQFCLHLPLQCFHPLLQAHLPLFRAVSLGKKETLFWDALSTAPLKLRFGFQPVAKVHAKCVISELSQVFTIAFDSTLILAQQPNSLHLCNFLLAICQVAFLFHQQLIKIQQVTFKKYDRASTRIDYLKIEIPALAAASPMAFFAISSRSSASNLAAT